MDLKNLIGKTIPIEGIRCRVDDSSLVLAITIKGKKLVLQAQ